jgi:catechol 2,3-dioxygenase-like lactoylglutathione lyase family enzyme
MDHEAAIKSNVKQAVPFFVVSDMEQSLRFYIDGLGFEMVNKWIDDGKLRWCWLQLGGAAIMLQEFRKQGQDSWVSGGKAGIGVSICFTCEDALSIYRDARSRGLQPKTPFVGNSMWVTELADPDGYKLFFESPTDEPEETIFAD